MERETAYFAVSVLVAGIGSEFMWPKETIETYVRALEDLSDGDLLVEVCSHLVKTWEMPNQRPTAGQVRSMYGQRVMRRELHATEVEPVAEIGPGGVCDWRRGVEIARAEYRKERERMGKPAPEEWFMYWLLSAWGGVKPRPPIKAVGRQR